MGNNEKAVLRTLLYSSLFDFPLSQDELIYYVNAPTPLSRAQIQKSLRNLSRHIVSDKGYYSLTRDASIIKKRIEMEDEVVAKMRVAKRVVRILQYLPDILFIGVSGSVAVGNVKEDDDIDLFIITKNNSIFTTRIICLLILSMLGKRRKRKERVSANNICLNMLVDASVLAMPKNNQDLYTAREIAQVYPLFDRGNYYKKFMRANRWIDSLLPNALKGRENIAYIRKKELSAITFSWLEFFTRKLQIWLIKRHTTNEVVSKKILAFHPKDTRSLVMQQFESRARKLNLL
jgi:predicted nucleotidyltransferase